jgi:hypothetical protein
MGWGGFLDKLLGVLPIQKRKERWKNQIDALEKERKELVNGECTSKKADRVIVIDSKLIKLNKLLKNASDAS